MTIAPALHSNLKKISSKHGSTLFITLLAGFKLLLHRLTSQDDIIVGVHSAGQLSVGGKDLMGFCINMLPLRSRILQDPTFTDYLASVRRRLFDAQKYQNYPFSKLVKKLNLMRDPSRPPLVSVVFNLDRSSGSESSSSFSGLEVTRIPNATVFARFDLLWNIIETDTQLLLDCTYNTDLFDEKMIERWMKYYETILQTIVARTDLKVSAIAEALAEADKQQQIKEANDLNEARLKRFQNMKRKVVSAV